MLADIGSLLGAPFIFSGKVLWFQRAIRSGRDVKPFLRPNHSTKETHFQFFPRGGGWEAISLARLNRSTKVQTFSSSFSIPPLGAPTTLKIVVTSLRTGQPLSAHFPGTGTTPHTHTLTGTAQLTGACPTLPRPCKLGNRLVVVPRLVVVTVNFTTALHLHT